MMDRVGQQLGNYRLVRLLGQGGFADVYLGEHLHLDTQAAIKVLRTHLAQEEWESFRKEARIIANLIHPHIVRLLDFGVQEGTPFLVMSYAPNGTLRRRHANGTPLAPAVILPYVRQVASALQYVHERKLIHRDVKPENLLLGPEGEVLLSDFGVATIAQSSRQPGDEVMGGTVAYMAPEQIQSKPCAASDQYALGVVVYEWLTGARPFDGSFTEVAAKQLLTPPQPLRDRIHSIPPVLEAVVLRALAKDPQERFPSVQAFAGALEAASDSGQAVLVSRRAPASAAPPASAGGDAGGTSPYPAPAGGDAGGTSPRSGSAVSVGAASAVTEACAADDDAFATRVLVSARLPPGSISSVPTEPLASPHKGVSRRAVLAGLAGLAATGGTLTWLALSHKPERSPVAAHPTPSPPRPTATPPPPPVGTLLYTYQGHYSPVYTVAWSPGGTRIASGSGTPDVNNAPDPRGDHTVQVWDARTGHLFLTYSGHTDSINAVAWSPDGTKIASASYDSTVQVWDAATGATLFTYRGHSDHVWAVDWSHDGNSIASAGRDGTVQVWKVGSQMPLFIYHGHKDGVSAVAWSPTGMLIASGSHDRTVQIWAVGDTKWRFIYQGHGDRVNALAWSSDGTRIASGGGSPGQHIDTTVHVWQPYTKTPPIVYTGHKDQVNGIAWSPDGARIASGGGDTEAGHPIGDITVQIWDASTGMLIYRYDGHHDVVESLDWSPDGGRIVSGSDDHTAQVWEAG